MYLSQRLLKVGLDRKRRLAFIKLAILDTYNKDNRLRKVPDSGFSPRHCWFHTKNANEMRCNVKAELHE